MKSSFFFLAAVLVFSIAGSAQVATINKFLGTAEKDISVLSQKSQTTVMEKARSKLPFIRDIEFRVRNRAFNEEQFQYSVRLTPEGFGEGRARSKLFKAQTALTEQQIQSMINEALVIRYNDVVDWLEDRVMLEISNELIDVLEDKIKVLEKKSFTNDFDLNNVIIAENTLTKTKNLNIETAKDISVVTGEIRRFLSDSFFSRFDTSGLVDVEYVADQVKLPSLAVDTENVYLNEARLKLRVSENKYNLEKAQQDGRYLSSVSFAYDYGRYLRENDKRIGYKTFDLNNAYYLELGFRLPFLTADGRDVAQRKEALIAAKTSYDIASRDLVEKMKRDVEDIGSFIAQYRYLKARGSEVDAQASLKKYLQMSGIDPLMILLVKEGILENRLRIEKARYDILRNYVRVLDSTGKLSHRPLKNFLSAAEETLAP
jgi:hypothetical protein